MKKSGIELQRLVAILDHVLVELQFAVAERPITAIATETIRTRIQASSPKMTIILTEKQRRRRQNPTKTRDSAWHRERFREGIKEIGSKPDILDGAGLGEEGIEDADGLGPVAGAADLGELRAIGRRRHGRLIPLPPDAKRRGCVP